MRFELPVESAGAGSAVVGYSFAPDPEAARRLPAPIWIFALHGAGEDSDYWDKVIPGHEDEEYSFAAFMSERGVGTVAIDHLGCGESPFPLGGAALTLETIATGHNEAANEIRSRLESGSLIPEVGALSDLFFVGLGHSGGSGVTMMQQGMFATFDAVVLMSMPADDFLYPNDGQSNLDAAIQTDDNGMVFIKERPIQSISGAFTPDTPQDIRDAFPPGRSFPPSHRQFMKNGTLAPYAQKISVPVLSVFGEVDLAATPLREQTRFGSQDVTSWVQPDCYHHVMAAPARRELMSTIYSWAWARAKYRD